MSLKINLQSLASIRGVTLLLTLIIGWFIVKNTPISEILHNYEWVRMKISQGGALGPLLFVLIGGLLTVFGFPRLVLSALGGFVFGFAQGVILALTGTVFGCVASFYYVRFMGRGFKNKGSSKERKYIESMLLKHSFLMSILIRNLPIGNNTVTNLIAGLTDVRPLPYFSGSLIGYLPLTVVFVLMGSGVQKDLIEWMVLSILLFFSSLGVLTLLFRRMKIREE